MYLQALDKYPYVAGQEPSLRGNADFLLHVSLLILNCNDSWLIDMKLFLYVVIVCGILLCSVWMKQV